MRNKEFYLFTIIFIVSFVSKAQVWPDARSRALFLKYKSVIVNDSATREKTLLVRLSRPLSFKEIEKIKPLRNVSIDHYIIREKASVALKDIIIAQTDVNPLWKAGDQLSKLYEQHTDQHKISTLKIAFNPHAKDIKVLLKYLKTYSIDYANNVITADFQIGSLLTILIQDAVLFADVVQKAKEEIAITGLDLSTNEISTVHKLHPEINGSSITVSLKEGMFDQSDIDIKPNVTALPANLPSATAHATIMATLALGRGNSFIRGKGAAPSAKLTSSDFSNLMPDAIKTLNGLTVNVQNHSYGTDLDNIYGIEAEAYDRQVFEADTMVHVFSAGNKGTTTPANGIYNGIPNTANLTGNFKQAKNLLVIGGINRENIPEALSSRGPAYDGRVKPELVALGEDGTSGAAALTSGTVALLQQAYKIRYGKQPSAALIKSILVNSADDIGTPQVDYITGFGKVNALNSVESIINNRFVTASVGQDQEYVFPLQVTANEKEIKVTLAWTDPPAQVNSALGIVNHLDLSLETPTGQIILPWVLSSYPAADSLSLAATRKVDNLNTVQQVTLENITAGNYQVHVKGRRIIQDKQQFAVAYQLKQADRFSWTFPENDDAVFAGEDNYLRWANTFDSQAARLSITYNNGATWNILSNSPDLGAGYFKWNTPHLFTTALVKMEISGREFISKPFTISSPMTLNVGFDCENKLLLHWKPQPLAAGYTLYNLRNDSLTAISQVADTLIEIDKSTLSSPYLAISANGPGFSGLKSYTIDYTSQGVTCYVRTFTGSLTGEMVSLQLSLGTTYNLKRLIWEKQVSAGIFTVLSSTSVVDGLLNYSIADSYPKPGAKFYRVTFETISGLQIHSDVVKVNFLKEADFVSFPNPVADRLSIVSGDFESYTLEIYNLLGQKLLKEEGIGNKETDVSALIPGIYLGVISRKGVILKRMKLIKLKK